MVFEKRYTLKKGLQGAMHDSDPVCAVLRSALQSTVSHMREIGVGMKRCDEQCTIHSLFLVLGCVLCHRVCVIPCCQRYQTSG